MRISDWSSDVCSSDLARGGRGGARDRQSPFLPTRRSGRRGAADFAADGRGAAAAAGPSAVRTVARGIGGGALVRRREDGTDGGGGVGLREGGGGKSGV